MPEMPKRMIDFAGIVWPSFRSEKNTLAPFGAAVRAAASPVIASSGASARNKAVSQTVKPKCTIVSPLYMLASSITWIGFQGTVDRLDKPQQPHSFYCEKFHYKIHTNN